MYESHPHLELPSLDTKIWRYMSFSKLVSLLETESLFFCHAIGLPDKWECTWAQSQIDSVKAAIMSRISDEAVRKRRLDDLLARDQTCVNCWNLNPAESNGMWAYYGIDGPSLAIKSSVGGLVDSLRSETRRVFIGRVQYKDLDQAKPEIPNNLFEVACTKRLVFADERELRAILWLAEFTEYRGYKKPGEYVSVDLAPLIKGIVFAPATEEWLKELVQRLLTRYGLKNVELNDSVLDHAPDLTFRPAAT
jgi:hypothetical protein